MKNLQVAILREGKIPHDHRVPFTPEQCRAVVQDYPNVELFLQPSPWRSFADSEYEQAGITLKEDVSGCDVFMGIKEVPVPDLIPGKTYLFFSHTIKKQAHNRQLLQQILEKKITLVDYE